MARFGELLGTLLRRRTPDADPLPDAELLRRFAHSRDQAAFELLVWRHGPMVLAACRRVLRDHHAAEDAFQAAFLVLARKAATVRGAAAGWLHKVALRVCLRMKRRAVVPLNAEPHASSVRDPLEASEQLAALDEEVARLPDWLRVPLVVCHLQGQSAEHAAALLGIPRGTVLSRLAAARKRLAKQLARRGFTAAVAVLVPAELSADVGGRIAKVATAFVVGRFTDTVSLQLAREVLAMTTRRTAVAVASALVLVAGFGTGVGLVSAGGAKPTPATTAEPDKKEKPPAAVAPPPADGKEQGVKREKLELMLKRVEADLAKVADTDDFESVRAQLLAKQLRLAELEMKVRTERPMVPPELQEQFEAAQERLRVARVAPVPPDVLAAAVKLHPKVAEIRLKITAIEADAREGKIPKDEAGRKKMSEERLSLIKVAEATEAQVGQEVEGYLRVPGIVEAQKATAVLERKVQMIERSADAYRKEWKIVQDEVENLRSKLTKLVPQAEAVAWLKEKRKRLKQELLELELR